MVRRINDKKDIDELFKIYFSCMGGNYFIDTLKEFSKGEGYGREYVCCTFFSDYLPWEEGYFGDAGVKISIDYPAYDNDVIAIISYEEFFQYLTIERNKFITQFPKKIDEVDIYLKKIKTRLSIE